MKYDFVAFGDITTDAFISLKDARVHCNINNENCELCVKFGQKIPYDSVTEVRAVGNGPNAAVAVHRLGITSTVVTDIGDDRNGDDNLEALKKEGVSQEHVRVHKGLLTNYHYVLQYEAERTILVKHEEYPYELPVFSEPPAWIYLTSLGENSIPYQHAIAKYCVDNGVKLAFQPGTFQIKLGADTLGDIYKASEIFFCNKEEAQQILKNDSRDVKELLSGIRTLGPSIAVITDGRNGASIETPEGAWSVPMYPDPAPPKDRTGAGDSTSSTTVAYIIKGLPAQEALQRGHINSASVVQEVGAQKGLLTDIQIDEWLSKGPAEFKATPL
ncbi:hypothetical protein COU18_02345 [Candidatus Kaiserbacteria bacterium CG10_big_fil_rev_8_21_14_0_10_51_14]|uniref:Carbohydrate kinase PfkB domain-containing protein n=1 Tax=Candidatus Kaiserbacteria bacterium CG10_big_fil_rev_8_21_14_0_10_51_14 TaxID=1974610 RepID=A0A2H0UBM2_9BACT|nr:MAG: hypothetical protein COU18_02345 [Candidatus Kaiserbacteria bacterium CG10_big_fil_rev_8_21_14_0_10_51_14]